MRRMDIQTETQRKWRQTCGGPRTTTRHTIHDTHAEHGRGPTCVSAVQLPGQSTGRQNLHGGRSVTFHPGDSNSTPSMSNTPVGRTNSQDPRS